MWNDRLRAYVAKAVYAAWKDQGQPQVIAASAVLEGYRRQFGNITPKVIGEVLAVMEDDSGTMPFLRVSVQNVGGAIGGLALTNIDPDRLLALAAEVNPQT
jgi:hypothetical protein